MINHKWIENKCVRCGIERQQKPYKLLMAVTNRPPYNHYKSGVSVTYLVNGGWTITRPDCDKIK